MPDVAELERNVLAKFVELADADPQGVWASYAPEIVAACEGHHTWADQVCRKLRSRKLLVGDGRGQWAFYYPSEKGVERARKDASHA